MGLRGNITLFLLVCCTCWCVAQEAENYVYRDSALLPATETTPAVDGDSAEQDVYDDSDWAPDTVLRSNGLAVERDSIQSLKRMKRFAYAKTLDSLLNDYQQSLEKDNADDARKVSWIAAFFLSPVTSVIFLGLGVVFVAVIVYKLFFAEGFLQRSFPSMAPEKPSNDGQDKAGEKDFPRLISEAASAGNYRLAVRFAYLETLHKLASRQLIQLAPEKTNNEYLGELSGKRYKPAFAALTRDYEYVWYGEFSIDAGVYRQLQEKIPQIQQRTKLKNIILSLIAVVLIAISFASCGEAGSKLPPLAETFSRRDKNPFGAFVLHNQLEQYFYHNTIHDVKKNFNDHWQEISDTSALYVVVSRNLFLSARDVESMLAFADAGNSVFISSGNIDPRLLDSLGCTLNTDEGSSATMNNTAVRLASPAFADSMHYDYFYFPFHDHFTALDSQYARVLGTNFSGPNFIVVFYGQGRFYLHTEPRALSNYFLLHKNNYRYLAALFSFVPAIPQHVYWDDYYNKRNYPAGDGGSRSGLSVLLQYPAMAWAFWLLVLLCCLYIFFGGKRRQRIMPTMRENTNTSVAFTETIGRLYLQKKDNRNIADKLITYFLEHLRNQYYLTTSHFNDEFITAVSRKSNNSQEGTAALFDMINGCQQSMEITDQQLLLLNRRMEQFYKKSL